MEPGTKLGHYEILAPLGAGGMGEVYRARDTTLDRDIAIKVLPDDFATDPAGLARFEREAKLLASLNHPNIATIHGFDESGGVRFIAMELVEGQSLAERITASGHIEVDETLEIARQIALGLEAAHEAGVIHRDLKPANVQVVPDGTVKVLDFGLAKAHEADGSEPSSDLSQSPTMMGATASGVIMGTAPYMSPEQARGKPVDKRTDIWAFGCVLYEMLAGKRAFDGETVGDTMAAIIRADPDWHRLPSDAPRSLTTLVRRCLEKDPRQRLRDIGDARLAMDGGFETGTAKDAAVVDPSPLPIWQRPVPVLAGMLLLTVTTALATWNLTSTGPNQAAGVTRLTLSLPEGQRQPRNMSAPIAISPDGTLLAYAARDETGVHLFVRPLDSFEARKIPDSLHADAPFFSPDGLWVGFVAAGQLRKVSISGGSPLTITRAFPLGASWGIDDTIVFTRSIGSGLFRVPAAGGTPEQLTQPDFGENGSSHVWPQHLPGGRHILFDVWEGVPARVLDLETREWHVARASIGGGGMYLHSGHIAASDPSGNGAFLADRFDLSELVASGSAVPVLDDVRYFDAVSGRPHIAISQTGTAVYASDEIGEATLMWVDREGRMAPVRRDRRTIAGVRLSPNGQTAVFHDEQGSLWTLDIERGAVDILARSTEFYSCCPTWNPDGRRVTFGAAIGGSWDLYEIDVAERGEPRPLLVRERDQSPESWSADGRLLSYWQEHLETGTDIWVLPRDEEPELVLATEANERQATLSPDGRLLAYVTDESGRFDVFVRTYPGGEVRGVSLDGGEGPRWSRDGRELFYHKGDRLHSVKVTTEPELDVSVPQELFEMPFARAATEFFGAYYDVSPDGERFLVVSDRSTTEFNVILNWFEELNRLVPTDP